MHVMSNTLSQCTLAGPVYTGIPLKCHWLIQCTLGYDWATQQILQGTLGHHWKTWLKQPHTRMPLEKLWLLQPTLEHHWRDYNSPRTPRHIVISRVASMPTWNDKMTEHQFTALQCILILLFKRVSTSTSLCACLGYDHHYSFCLFSVAVQMKSA